MSFDGVANNLVKLPVVSHSSGSGSLVLGVSGAAFPAAPFRLTVITGGTYGSATETLTIFGVTAVATDTPTAGQCTLTVSAIEGTTDRAYTSSDFAEMRLTAGTIGDLNTQVNANTTALNGVPTGVLKGVAGVLTAATAGTDYLTGNQTITLSGDTTGSGATAIATTTAKVNGVSYPASPSTNTVPVVTGVNTITYEAVPNAALANSSVTISGHAVPLGGSVSLAAADVGLGSVTNDAQTKAAIVPNTAPAAGQILVGNAGGTAYAKASLSGDGTLSSAGALTIASNAITTAKINANAVTNAKMASGTINTLAGYDGTGAFSGVAVGSGLSLSGSTLAATGGGGSVTSVGLTLPSIFVVSGSPVTTSGTLTGTLATQSANVVFAGPTTGVATAPTFRALVTADLPTGIPNANLQNSSVTISGHALSLGGTLSLAASDVGLGSVTNDAQTKAAVVPNTAPSAGQVLVGNAGGTAYAKASLSGDGTLSSAGALTVTKTNGVAFAASATTDTTSATNITSGTLAGARMAPFVASGASHAQGAVPDPGATAGTTKFLREDATWAVPAGGSASPGGSDTQIQYNSSGAFAGASNLTVGSAGQLNFASQAAPVSPNNGDTWRDSTQGSLAYRQSGLTIFRPGLVYSQSTPGTVSGAGTASLVNTSGAIGTVSLPAGALNVQGRMLEVWVTGYFSTTASPGTARIDILLGSTIVGTVLTNTMIASQTNRNWWAQAALVVATTGATGTVNAGGTIAGQGLWNGTAVTDFGNGPTGGSPSPTAVTLDLTSALTFDVQWTFGAASNSMTATNLTLKVWG